MKKKNIYMYNIYTFVSFLSWFAKYKEDFYILKQTNR